MTTFTLSATSATLRQLVEQVVLTRLQAFDLKQNVCSVSFHRPGVTIGSPVLPVCECSLGNERTDTRLVSLLGEVGHLFIGHGQIRAQT
jgi:hypothetical protein|tara:strand:+ start:8958 stop:9224 length:267 start_codon:yes stop_codon:yes gene_type:complete